MGKRKGTHSPMFNQPRPVERVGKTGVTRIRRMLAIEVFNADLGQGDLETPIAVIRAYFSHRA